MTPIELQRALKTEGEKILKDIQTKSTMGKQVVGVKGFIQRLPEITGDEEDESDLFPYFIVRLGDGGTEDDEDPWTVTVNILFGAYDAGTTAQGHLHIMTMIQRFTDRFLQEPLLDGKYRADAKMEWALQDEDTYPYYFGGVELKFHIAKMGRKDLYA